MRKYFVNLLFTNLLFVNLLGNWQFVTSPLPFFQSECIKEAVGEAEIIFSQTLDVDGDGRKDQVVLYGKDNVYVIVALDRSSELCELALNKRLTALKLVNPITWRNVKARKIEMIELTGDDIPELHIWLEKTGAPSRYEHAVHSVYSFRNEGLQEILSTEQCLAFSNFEFRNGPNGNAKEVYIDTDSHCELPWSFQRTYTIMRWDGTKFMPAENGTVTTFTTSSLRVSFLCIAIPIGVVIISTLIVIRLRKSKA